MKTVLKWLAFAIAGAILLLVFATVGMAGKLSMAIVGFGLWFYERSRASSGVARDRGRSGDA